MHHGLPFVGGQATRYLFHGTSSQDVVNKIVKDRDGFSDALNTNQVWGPGTYFARDSIVSAAYGRTCKDDVGHYMLILCLVVAGIPMVGDGLNTNDPNKLGRHFPAMHPDSPLRYSSYVDSAANPEYFVTNNGYAYPAYVIHYTRN